MSSNVNNATSVGDVIHAANLSSDFPSAGFTSRAFCVAASKVGRDEPSIADYFESQWTASLTEVAQTGRKPMALGCAKFLATNDVELLRKVGAMLKNGAEPATPEPAPEKPEPAPVAPTPEPAPEPAPAAPAAPAGAMNPQQLQMFELFQQIMLGGGGGGGALSDEDKAKLVTEVAGKAEDSIMEKFGPNGGRVTKIQVIDKAGEPVGKPGMAHAITELAMKAAIPSVNLNLTGPAGSGKTTLAAKVAEARGIKFVPVSCNPMMTPGQLIGARGLNGFEESVLIKACREATLLLLDEFDNMRGDLAAITNSVLANRTITIPVTGETLEVHPDTVFVAAMNTFGTGATDLYQRQRIDAATMDRFFVLDMQYDPALEAALIGADISLKSPDYRPHRGGELGSKEQWLQFVMRSREAIAENKIQHVVSPRASMMGIQLAEQGVGLHWLKEGLVFKGLKPNQRKLIEDATKELKLTA